MTLIFCWRWMLPGIGMEKLIVFHDSLLPRYRGFAPLVNALLNREPRVGLTALLGGAEYDTGDILAQKALSVTYPITIKRETGRLAALYADLAEELFQELTAAGRPAGQPQDEALASYSLWRDEDDYRIQWDQQADRIEHFIACVGPPYKGASALLNGERMRIFEAVEVQDRKIENRDPGKVVFFEDSCPVVVCGRGLLKLTSARWDDGRPALPLKSVRSRLK